MARGDFFTLERRKVTIYSSFHPSFQKNPNTGSLAHVTNENAVKRSLRNLVLTGIGERFYDSNKGTRIRKSLFEPFDPASLELVRLQLLNSINTYEPRANPVDVQIIDNLDVNSITVRITFQIINIVSDPISIDVFVEKVR